MGKVSSINGRVHLTVRGFPNNCQERKSNDPGITEKKIHQVKGTGGEELLREFFEGNEQG